MLFSVLFQNGLFFQMHYIFLIFVVKWHHNFREIAVKNCKYKLLCPRGTQTCALAVANIAHAVYLLDVAKRPIPQG